MQSINKIKRAKVFRRTKVPLARAQESKSIPCDNLNLYRHFTHSTPTDATGGRYFGHTLKEVTREEIEDVEPFPVGNLCSCN